MMIPKSDCLFSKSTLLELIQKRNGNVITEIDALTELQIIEGNLEECAAALFQKFELQPIKLLTDKIQTVKPVEADIDVRHDPFRMIGDRSRPHYAKGTAIAIAVPFTGDALILQCQPSTIDSKPPCGVVVANELQVTYEGLEIDPAKMRAEFDSNLRAIQEYLRRGAEQVNRFNTNLRPSIQNCLTKRREKFLQERRTVQALGFPIRERVNAPQVYKTPIQRKKVTIAKALPVGQSTGQEPFVEMAAYEDILRTIASMARVLELNPKAFAKMEEESLRFMLLVPLNIHYEGQATGETFNWEGKTDIIIKVGGRNVFIAECLIWAGAEYFKSKIDQLLGYTSWRDTKAAIVIFNRNKHLSAVLSQIQSLVKAHPNCMQEVATYKHETGFRFILHHRGDQNRELTVTVLVFDVPA